MLHGEVAKLHWESLVKYNFMREQQTNVNLEMNDACL